MKISRITFLVIALSGYLNAAVDYQQAVDSLARSTNMLANIDNIVEKGLSADAEAARKKAIDNISEFVLSELAKERGFGQNISAANKDAIRNSLAKLVALNNQFMLELKKIRANNFNFTKDNYAEIAPKLQAINNQVVAVVNQATKVIPEVRSALASTFGDTSSKQAKEILRDKLAVNIEDVIQIFLKHWSALNNKVAVGAKLEEQKARDIQLGKIKK